MASHGHQMYPQAASRYAPAPHGAYGAGGHGNAAYTSPPPPAAVAVPGVAAPAGTFAPGTKIQVGSHRVVIQKYLSEGGFAHVYVVKLPKPIDGTDLAVLKRVAVPDKENLRGMRTEVETMKRLKGHRMIVTYIDSHASEMRGGGYEVFLLMEYCSGGGLIDFMNTRLQHRLTEPEILNIFCDIAEGLACMHYLKPPLLHRDLKIENVLITRKGSSKRFKLCDFGSAASPKPAPTSIVECRLMDEDIQKHTTLQYRSPEMIDVYRKQPMNEKIDIWALGVFLYKLCYYTTPFEDQGQLAILNVSYKFPSSPPFSDRLKKLIASMLRENMESRPNVYQVLKEACAMQGRDVPIQDIYSERPSSESTRHPPSLPPKDDPVSQPAVGAVFSPPAEEKPHIPEVVPMRRGRPTAPTASTPHKNPSPQPLAQAKPPPVTKGDPFAALDSKSPPVGSDPDDFSSRFPSLDQFSLLHDQGSRFDFDSSQQAPPVKPTEAASQKVTQRLADEAFATSRTNTPPVSRPQSRPQSVTPAPATGSRIPSQYGEHSQAKPAPVPLRSEVSLAQTIISSNPELQAISSQSQSTSRYVSTGTSTDDLPYEQPLKNLRRVNQGPAADMPRSASAPRHPNATADQIQSPEPRLSVSARVNSLQVQPSHARHSSSSPAVEASLSPPDIIEAVPRTSLSMNRSRPSSTNFENSTIDFLREKEIQSRPQSTRPTPSPRPSPNLIPTEEDEPKPETSDLEFLRSMEEPKSTNKRSSLTSLSGSKHMLAGRFGDAFKKFEGSNQSQPGGGRSPSPLKDLGRRDLTPIAGSEATDGRSDDGYFGDDLDNMPPEQRRELERRKLQEEEARVEAAQAEYRKRVAEGGSGASPAPSSRNSGGVPRAQSIQNRVHSLLSEEQKPAIPQRTAQGYGKYTDESPTETRRPEIPRKPVAGPKPQLRGSPALGISSTGPASAQSMPPRPSGKPVAPKKPGHLNSLPTGGSAASPTKPSRPPVEQLVAVDLPGQPALDMTAEDRDSYIRDFTQRFPSLSAMDTPESNGGRR